MAEFKFDQIQIGSAYLLPDCLLKSHFPSLHLSDVDRVHNFYPTGVLSDRHGEAQVS